MLLKSDNPRSMTYQQVIWSASQKVDCTCENQRTKLWFTKNPDFKSGSVFHLNLHFMKISPCSPCSLSRFSLCGKMSYTLWSQLLHLLESYSLSLIFLSFSCTTERYSLLNAWDLAQQKLSHVLLETELILSLVTFFLWKVFRDCSLKIHNNFVRWASLVEKVSD